MFLKYWPSQKSVKGYLKKIQEKKFCITVISRPTRTKSWFYWFIGFIDAEGSFQTFPKKRSKLNGRHTYYNIGYGFHLALSIDDKNLLKQIHSNLKFIGNYYEYPQRKEVRLGITKLTDLKWLILNVFSVYPLLTKHQRERFERLKFGVLSGFNRVDSMDAYKNFLDRTFNITPPNLKDLVAFDNWMCGFINGEGTFYIHPKGFLSFYIEQKESEVLMLIRDRLKATPKVLKRASRGLHRNVTYSLAISSKKDIKSLVDFFSQKDLIPLAGKKRVQFEKWKAFYFESGKY